MAGLAVAAAGIVGAAYIALTFSQLGETKTGQVGSLVGPVLMGLLLGVAVVMLYRRANRRAIGKIAEQVRQMKDSGEVGLVMLDATDELSEVTGPLNEFLSGAKERTDDLRAENREFRIEARIAEAEKRHTEAIIFSISDAVIVTNRFDELILANQAAEKLLGFKLDNSVRKNIERICADGTLVRLIRETRSHARNVTRKVVEHTIDHKGEGRTFKVTLSCVVGNGEEVSGVVAVLHDVTREREIAQMKTDFVSNVSHELKTPLSSIKAYIEMLTDGEAEDESTRQEFYEIISSETNRLHRLIENILNISRIESGVVKVVREPLSLTAVVTQVLDVAVPQAKAKSIQLSSNLAPVYYQVEADRDMVYQAALNLISNAIKYTPEGGSASVSVSVDDHRNVAIFEVKDTGMGIPAEDLPHIFDKFYRVEANKKIAKGTGLGLTLVKHIIETVHEGALSVTSEQGKGSTFGFELPIIE
ncbi:MAG: sensor histidine kinase [Planctomycetota bacterium]|jgi:two-component system phosphate regulon sensor histidine kinase PhoR